VPGGSGGVPGGSGGVPDGVPGPNQTHGLPTGENNRAMDDRLARLLEELHRHGAEYDAARDDRLERLRNVEPDTARVLAVLVLATGAQRLLELGTSNGYSTLWMADALRGVGGRLLRVDVDAARHTLARENLARAGLHEVVELRVQDAAVTLREAPEEAWDMIFLDAERSAYSGYWPGLVRVLRLGGLLAVDNVLSHAEEVREFRALVSSDERVSDAVVPTGAGLLLVVRNPRGS
jgi:predicted O-methyltransferase YrrM